MKDKLYEKILESEESNNQQEFISEFKGEEILSEKFDKEKIFLKKNLKFEYERKKKLDFEKNFVLKETSNYPSPNHSDEKEGKKKETAAFNSPKKPKKKFKKMEKIQFRKSKSKRSVIKKFPNVNSFRSLSINHQFSFSKNSEDNKENSSSKVSKIRY